jgi:hypothetical protein
VTTIQPDGVPTLGATSVIACVAIADMAAPSLATEINAATSVDLTFFLTANGWNPTATSNKGTRPARLGSKRQRESFNRTTFSLATLMYVFDPQLPDTDAQNKAKALLAEGTTVYFVERIGPDAETVPWAVGDNVIVHKMTLGVQANGGDRTDENGEFVKNQDAIYANLEGPVEGVLAA